MDQDEIEALRREYTRKHDRASNARDAAIAAIADALEAEVERIRAEQKLHKGTGRYTASDLRDLEHRSTFLLLRRNRCRQIIQKLLDRLVVSAQGHRVGRDPLRTVYPLLTGQPSNIRGHAVDYSGSAIENLRLDS
jgi:hypothetical protein